jgi:hypothetical protein
MLLSRVKKMRSRVTESVEGEEGMLRRQRRQGQEFFPARVCICSRLWISNQNNHLLMIGLVPEATFIDGLEARDVSGEVA